MYGSDLAPFVAAVLNDRTVAGLIQENNELKSKLTDSDDERLLVKVTGQHGSPIHYEESLKNAKRFDADEIDEIVLDFDNDGSSDGFPLSSLDKIEIRLGGVVVQRFNIDDLDIQFDHDLYDEENQMKEIWLRHINRRHLYGPIEYVDGKIGPLPLGWRHTGGGNMLLTDLLELVADENNDLTPQTLIIKALIFDEKDITGVPDLRV